MALVQLNSVNVVDTRADSGYDEIVLYPLNTDAGPNGYSIVSSLDDLRSRFYPKDVTRNWLAAEILLDIGYKLLVAKLGTTENYLSLRIFEPHTAKKVNFSVEDTEISAVDAETGISKVEKTEDEKSVEYVSVPVSYSHPKRNVEYDYVEIPWKIANRDGIILPPGFSYSVKIPIPSDFIGGNYMFLTLKHDTDLSKSGQVHRFIGFGEDEDFAGLVNSEVATDMQYISLFTDKEKTVLKERSKILEEVSLIFNRWGIFVEYIDDNYVVISSFLPIKVGTSCKYSTKVGEDAYSDTYLTVLDNKSASYDIICAHADQYKVLDFYSKECYSSGYIKVELIKNFDGRYSLYINEIVEKNNEKITLQSEYYRVSLDRGDKYFIETVLQQSKLVDCFCYKNGDVEGTFYLRPREDGGNPSKEEALNTLKQLPVANEKDFDIIVDADLDEEYQQYLYNAYKNVECIKLFQLLHEKEYEDSGLKYLSPADNYTNGVSYTYPRLVTNGVSFPLWLYILYLIKRKGKFGGAVNAENAAYFTYKNENGEEMFYPFEKTEPLILLESNEYGFVIPVKKIKTQYSFNVSLDLLWMMTMVRNKIIPSINPNLSFDDYINTFNSKVRTVLTGKSSRISACVITGIKRTDRNLLLNIDISHDDVFVDNVSISITVNIS